MQFKDDNVKNEFWMNIPIFLQMIVADVDSYSVMHFNKELFITRVLEFVKGDSGVHEHHRGVDARDEHDGKFYFTAHEIELILDYVRFKYPRNDKFATLIHHSFMGGPQHLHFQLAESTLVYIPIQKGEPHV